MMGAREHEVIATLLLSLFWFVLVGIVLLAFIVTYWRSHRTQTLSAPPPRRPEPLTDFHPSTLRRPDSWLAIKSRNLLAVQQALALHNPQPCSWADGLAGSTEQRIFVSPPVSGWVLVVGASLPEPSEDVDVCFRFLMEISRKLGHVQFFSSNIMLNHHAWAQVEAGRVTRAYAWAGKTLWNQGKTTQAEADLAMHCYDYGETAEISFFRQPQAGSANSDKVHLLAARWSIDPEEIDERFVEQEWGIVGEPSRHF